MFRKRINTITALGLISLAVFADLIIFLLNFVFPLIGGVIGILIAIVFILIFSLWLKFLKVKFTEKILSKFYIVIVIKLIPILNMVPAFTRGMISKIRVVRSEDKEYNKELLEFITKLKEAKNIQLTQDLERYRQKLNLSLQEVQELQILAANDNGQLGKNIAV